MNTILSLFLLFIILAIIGFYTYLDMSSNITPVAPAVIHAADCEAKDNAALLLAIQTNNELLKKLVNPRQ